jgi:glycosyltransferase involved in cell wall biosynthesis
MKVLVIADPHIPVPPRSYGGTERIAALTCQALVALGHTVVLLAGPGSRDYGGGLTVHRAPTAALSSRGWRKALFLMLTAQLSADVDLVICHGRYDYLGAILARGVPLLLWMHNPVVQADIDYLLDRGAKKVRFVGISQAQVRGLIPAHLIEVVYNCVDTDRNPFASRPATPPYVAFLGRLTPNKGVHLAIQAARRAGVPLIIGGNITDEPGVRAYFDSQVRPELGGSCRWIGPYDDRAKMELLQGASALLFPIQWDEPFGLVMIEALACGTPVIAVRRGSTPEVVRHGETGFLCGGPDDMAVAIHRAPALDRAACRRDVEERFSTAAFRQHLARLCQAVTAD